MAEHHTNHKASPALIVAALGVVYGDIGTSPLYAFRESIGGDHGAGVANTLGVLSLIFWAITLVVSVKYVLIVLRANNGGEGGILALLALVLRQMPAAARLTGSAIALGLLGAAMFYGDSVITPAISVLSAIEGLEVISPHFTSMVIPLTLVVLVTLFAVQRFGTARVGSVFGPVMLVWFVVLGMLGAVQIAREPGVLLAIDPVYAIEFLMLHPAMTFLVFASVFLAVTGGEALYADMGHFGRAPIQVAWFWLVMPCLVLNYFGQGSLVIASPEAVKNPFFLLAPPALQFPLVLLATAATVIASQAVISGAFSITSQAIKLGYLPRVSILFTSETAAGQIYVPAVNWLLLALVVLLVVAFGTSSNLAAAYGIAVSSTMVITTLGVMVVARHRWDWAPWKLVVVLVPLLLLDVMFLLANTAKITHGGWFPLVFGALVFFLFATWKRGRQLVKAERARGGIALEPFLKSLAEFPPQRVEGTAVFMSGGVDEVPHSLLHNLKHNRVLHERVIFLTAVPQDIPRVEPEYAAEVRDLGTGCFYVKVYLGFKDSYDIADIAKTLARHFDFVIDVEATSFFLSRETVLSGRPGGMADWRERLFGWMMHNAQPASDFFRIPPNRVIEIGTQIVI
ncbi:MAG TPA: potassium transporter Kup [Burkholderiaceae bacterium]|nr:potassium transporter Kup [Burkholderiaceae bacterium]HQR70700.1 potassium transporter Kup [Burkholderiaceae bacterium]